MLSLFWVWALRMIHEQNQRESGEGPGVFCVWERAYKDILDIDVHM